MQYIGKESASWMIGVQLEHIRAPIEVTRSYCKEARLAMSRLHSTTACSQHLITMFGHKK